MFIVTEVEKELARVKRVYEKDSQHFLVHETNEGDLKLKIKVSMFVFIGFFCLFVCFHFILDWVDCINVPLYETINFQSVNPLQENVLIICFIWMSATHSFQIPKNEEKMNLFLLNLLFTSVKPVFTPHIHVLES